MAWVRAIVTVVVWIPSASSLITSSVSSRLPRVASISELPRVAQLQLDTFDPVPDQQSNTGFFASLFGGGGGSDRAARADRLADELTERVAKGSDILVVIEDETSENIVGTADLSEQEMLLPTHSLTEGLYLSSMAVQPSSRRQGIGLALLHAAEECARGRGAEGVWMHVERDNVAALGLYQKNGYMKQAATPRHNAFTSALKLGQVEPLLLYKELAVPSVSPTESKGSRTRPPSMSCSMSGGMSGGKLLGLRLTQRSPRFSLERVQMREVGKEDDKAEAGAPPGPPPPPTAPAAAVFANAKAPILLDSPEGAKALAELKAREAREGREAGGQEAAAVGGVASEGEIEEIDEEKLFEQAVEAARQSQQKAAEARQSPSTREVERAIAKGVPAAAFKTEEENREFAAEWTQRPLQSYVNAMIDESSTLGVPRTPDQKAAAGQPQPNDEALKPKAWWQEALGMAGNVVSAAGERMAEADAKRAEELKAQGGAVDPLGSFLRGRKQTSLYKQV